MNYDKDGNNWCVPAISDATADAVSAAAAIIEMVQANGKTARYINWTPLRDDLNRADAELVRSKMYAAMVYLPFAPEDYPR